ncbi:hypothetical protein CH254_23465 [Rhodococcus sp. 06-412-2C]|uniref:hypothetical protein n=1 Tax=unclassified Rhodococcus (in: high G+C Gram-positive bacteria) TaxID=192944 RepID=UPI000B9C589C|nr:MULTISPECIES: hypothetical protein [unclassified Rhodococcus (in: high G+C Gram-positive bacteria)]OZC83855.1 hypothetical protein CH254_23465 [Rhodococcus sp. 06-412-2C]OZC94043.1 hypothetical protein CH279_21550 [Rhodococcus sp. 06-412-2B]
MYDEPEYRYPIDVYGTVGMSLEGEIECFRVDPPLKLGRFTFGVFRDIQVVETLQLNNHTERDDHESPDLGGLGMAMFQRLMDHFRGYEFRISGPLENQTESGQHFINAVRNGNVAKGRDPLPYHDNGCFNGREECVCPLGGRQRDQ